MDWTQFLILLAAGLVIGAIGVLFGGSSFLALPVYQILFPEFSYAQIMGNIRVGSLTRSAASTWSTFKQIDFKKLLSVLIPFLITAVIGVFLISKLDQSYLFYAVLAAILLTEISPYLARWVNEKTRVFFSLILGLYYGFIGAGSGLLIFALLRTLYPQKAQIAHAKIQARFIEALGVALVLLVHILNGDLLWLVWLPWALGAFIGGFIGARILKSFTQKTGAFQHVYLYCIYALALLPFIIRFIQSS